MKKTFYALLIASISFSILAFADDSIDKTNISVKSEPSNLESTIDGVAALVNGDAITISEVVMNIHTLLSAIDTRYINIKDPTVFQSLYNDSLENLINNKLVIQAYQSSELRLPEDAINKRIAEIIENRFDSNRSKLLDFLAQANINYDTWKKQIENSLIVSAMEQMFVYSNIYISAGDILNEYNTNKDKYNESAKAKLNCIILSSTNNLQNVTSKIESDGFIKAANEFSENPASIEIGWVAINEDLNPIFAKVANTLKKGEISEPIHLNDSFIILQKEDEKLAVEHSLADVQKEIKDSLTQKEAQRLSEKWIKSLRSHAQITVFEVK